MIKNGSYRYKEHKTTIVDQHTNHNNINIQFVQSTDSKQLPSSTNDSKSNPEAVKLLIILAQALVEEYRRNEQLQRWIKTSFMSSKQWISKQLQSGKQSILLITHGTQGIADKQHTIDSNRPKLESSSDPINRSFILLPTVQTDDERIRTALGLPLTGYLTDAQILQLNEPTVVTKDQLKRRYFELAHKWHPDHFQPDVSNYNSVESQKQFANQVFLYISNAYHRLDKQ